MSTLIYSGTHGANPNMTYKIYYTATRNKNTVTVNFDIVTTLNNGGVIYTLRTGNFLWWKLFWFYASFSCY